MCCVCAGSCNHIGNHTYCAAHGGPVYQPAVQTGTGANWWPWSYSMTRCDHCFCEDAEDWHPDHKKCCKCATRMHVQFVFVVSRDEER